MPQRVSLAMSGKVSNRTGRRRRSFAARWQPRPPALASCDPLRLPSALPSPFGWRSSTLAASIPAARAACSARSQSPFSALLCAAGPIFMPGIIPRCSACGSAGVCGASACRLVLTCGVSQPSWPAARRCCRRPTATSQPGGREEQQPGQQRHAQRDMPMAVSGEAPFTLFSLRFGRVASHSATPPSAPPTAEAASSL